MNSENPKWCAKCLLRIAPYEVRTVYQAVAYHQSCFLKLVREQADEEIARRAQLRGAKRENNQYEPSERASAASPK
jgi:hypothetical protein